MSAGAEAFYVVAEYVDELTYKPGTRFDIWREPHSTVVAVSRELPNARKPEGPPVLVMLSTQIADAMVERCLEPQTYISFKIRRLIHEMEQHEADEYLRIDGALVHDPHSNSKGNA